MAIGIKSGNGYYLISDSVLKKCKVSKKQFDLACKKAAEAAQVAGQGDEVSMHFVFPKSHGVKLPSPKGIEDV
jgi:hypothetical protein